MYCTKCGKEIQDTDIYCTACGNPLKEDEMPISISSKTNRKGKNRRYIVAILIIVVLILSAALLNGGKKINLDSYLTVEFSGWDGYGKAKAVVNYDAFLDDYATKLEYTDDYYMTSAYAVDAFVHYMDVDIDQSYGLSNGDTVCVTWDISESDLKEIEKRFNYNVKFSDSIELEVTGLSALKECDPFETMYVVFEGISGEGEADTRENDSRFSFRLNVDGNLSNGQTITAELVSDPEYYASNYGILPTVTEKTFVVEGLSEPMMDFSQIRDEDLQSMIDEGSAYITDKYFRADTNGNQENFCEELNYCGTLYFTPGNYKDNYAIVIYKVKGKLTKPGYETKVYSFYHPVLFKTLILNSDGSVDYKRSAYAPKMEHLGRVSIKKLDDENVLELVYLDGFKTLEEAVDYYSDKTSVWYPS